MKDKTIETIVAILAITVLEMTAMIVLHLDGVILSSVIAVIAGMAGYKVAGIRLERSKEDHGVKQEKHSKKKEPPGDSIDLDKETLEAIEDL